MINDATAGGRTIIGNAISGKGRLYCYGGDEFCVSLKNFTLEEAAVTLERSWRQESQKKRCTALPMIFSDPYSY